jgi:hypothetical protein
LRVNLLAGALFWRKIRHWWRGWQFVFPPTRVCPGQSSSSCGLLFQSVAECSGAARRWQACDASSGLNGGGGWREGGRGRTEDRSHLLRRRPTRAGLGDPPTPSWPTRSSNPTVKDV